MKKIILTFLSVLVLFKLEAQTKWTLQQCIEQALKNNISLKQTEITSEISELNYNQSIAGILPSLNAGANHTYNIGRTIDRYTNTFANSNILSQNFYLSSQVTLWSGMSQYNAIKQNQYTLLASKENLEQQKNDLSLNVATSFLEVIYNRELIKVAQSQVNITSLQLERTQKLVEGGTLAKTTLFDIKAQLANDEYTFTSAQNNYNISMLALKQLLNIDTLNNFDIETPNLDVVQNDLMSKSVAEIYLIALGNQHNIKSAEYALFANEKGLASAKGRLSPTLSLSGSIGTGYSGLAQQLVSTSFAGYNPIGFTSKFDTVYTPYYETVTRKKSFADQFKDNINKSVGLQLSIPLFNGLQNYTAIKTAKLQLLNSKFTYDMRKQQLYKAITKAYADAEASLNKYLAAKSALTSAEEAFTYTQQKFSAGAISVYDFSLAKNRLLKSQADILNAKFDYVFKLKVLDFYQGKPLGF